MMSVPPRLAEIPGHETVEKVLGHLCTYALRNYWVVEQGRILMGLDCVRAHLREEAAANTSEEDLGAALVSYLEDAVQKIDSRPHRIILEVVLGLGADRWKADSWRDQTATRRRAEAGRSFRDGDRPVTYGTIRQHHEPRAIRDLAEIICQDERLAREGSAQGNDDGDI
jgi:hypothetical protein